jgi:uncharacterized RDD family membrane protein YckC
MRGKIACATHANREATTSCGACGLRLCDSCAFTTPQGLAFCEAHAPAEALSAVHHEEDYEAVPVIDPARTGVATFGSRLVAAVADSGIWAMVTGVLAVGVFGLGGSSALLNNPFRHPAAFLFWAVPVLGALVYTALMTGMGGQTWGQKQTGVIVLQPDGHTMTTRQTVIRTLAMVLSVVPLGLGFLWMLWDKDGDTWHDKIAGTKVFEYANPT